MVGWRSRRKWPPSPFVEDEYDSLAHELSTASSISSKSDDEAPSRGTVDQYPIILDVGHPVQDTNKNASASFDRTSLSSRSSDESLGPDTPPSSAGERPRSKQFTTEVHRHPTTPQDQAAKASEADQRSKPIQSGTHPSLSHINTGHATSNQDHTAQSRDHGKQDKCDESRGRPSVSRIDTQIDGEIQHMLSGRRRAPSPYSYVKPTQEETPKGKSRFSGDSFLAPEAALPRPTAHDTSRKRSTSINDRREKRSDVSSSEDSDRRNRHHSRRRSTRPSQTLDYRPAIEREEGRPRADHRHSESPSTMSAAGSFSSGYREERHRNKHDDHSDSDRRRFRRDSPYTSSAEESKPRIRERSRIRDRSTSRPERPSFTHLPRHSVEVLGSSTAAISSPGIDHRYDGGRHRHDVPSSRHDPESDRRSHRASSSNYRNGVIEGQDWEKALHDNRTRPSSTLMPSPQPSPRSSPPNTPPRTPRSSKPAVDYFSSVPLVQSNPGLPSRHARSGTLDDMKPPHPPSRTVTLDEGRLPSVSRVTGSSTSPILPRSPRFSTDSYSSISSVPSPAAEARQRPYTGTLLNAEQRSLPRTMSYSAGMAESPRIIQRAFSYSGQDQSSVEHLPSTRSSQVYTVASTSSGRSKVYTKPHSQDHVPKSPVFDPSSIDLPKCPNSEPTFGNTGWYSITHIPELNFCRTCMAVLGRSHFRNLFEPSRPEITREKVSCAMSDPWFRLGWIQTMKQRRTNLEILSELVKNRASSKACPGRTLQSRSWYLLYDPERDETLPDFSACSVCVRSIVILFPQYKQKHDFVRRSQDLVQEKTCHLDCHSRRFQRYMALLEAAAMEYDSQHLPRPDMSDFRHFARKASRYRECQKSDQLANELWHFIPQLPEFTICEECFHDVVWPVRDQPVANMVNRTLQPVPRPDRHETISCQLYSERMRKVFQEAIRSRDFPYLSQMALRRYQYEKILMQKTNIILKAQEKGLDRTDELGELIAKWKQFE